MRIEAVEVAIFLLGVKGGYWHYHVTAGGNFCSSTEEMISARVEGRDLPMTDLCRKATTVCALHVSEGA